MSDAVVRLGDCLDLLRDLPDNSVDSVVTDSPYGLSAPPDMATVLRAWLDGGTYEHGKAGFMGAKWDSFVPGPRVWREVFRVLKPGGHLITFAGTRTVDLMGISLRLADFETRDTVHWAQWQGMPKGLNVGKAIDKQRHDREQVLQVTRWIAQARDAAGLTNRDIDDAFGFAGMAGHWTSQKSQPAVPTLEQWARLLEVLRVPLSEVPDNIRHLAIDLNTPKGVPGVNWERREVVGQGYRVDRQDGAVPNARLSAGAFDITTPATPEATRWEGWSTTLAPTIEPALLVRKPLSEGTVAPNVMRWGTGALNIGGCRHVPGAPEWPGPQTESWASHHGTGGGAGRTTGAWANPYEKPEGRSDGRWPANLIYVPKASRTERERGCADLPLEAHEPMSEVDTRRLWSAVLDGRLTSPEWATIRDGKHPAPPWFRRKTREQRRRNTHSAVKPVRLMRWLCRLVTPPAGLVLDPFAGSGSCGVAAVLEGFQYIGMELEGPDGPSVPPVDYHAIACARIAHAQRYPDSWADTTPGLTTKTKDPERRERAERAGQVSLFGGGS